MSVRSLLAVAVVGLVLSVSAEAAGDPVRGKNLGYTCLGCHGIENYKNVYPTYAVPRLRGQQPEYLVAALKAYKKSERSHGTMHAHASSLSDEDMEDVAAYLSGDAVKAPEATAPSVGVPTVIGAVCAGCHGPTGQGMKGLGPTLAGQHADYLEHSIESYRSGSRKNALMGTAMPQLKEADIKAVAHFYAKQKPLLSTVPKIEKKVAAK